MTHSMGKPGLLLVAMLVFGAGCTGRSSQSSFRSQDPVLIEAKRVDSIVFEEGCTEYTGYFASGSLNRSAVENVRRVIFDGPVIFVNFDRCTDAEDVEFFRGRVLDSLSALAWLDGEPWGAMRELFLKWAEQQLERHYIVYKSREESSYLYDCSETDSVLIRIADIMTRSGDRYTDEVRHLWVEYPERSLSQIDLELSGPDSIERAYARLYQLLSNHINRKIHSRLGKDGTVDFFEYNDAFLKLFDSVKVETWEP